MSAERQNGDILVKSVRGQGSYTTDGVNWLPLRSDVVLNKGTILRTEGNSTADVILKSSGTALRLIPGTLLEIARFETEVAGEETITRTVLDLRSGGLIGSQRKLDSFSSFQITTSAAWWPFAARNILCGQMARSLA